MQLSQKRVVYTILYIYFLVKSRESRQKYYYHTQDIRDISFNSDTNIVHRLENIRVNLIRDYYKREFLLFLLVYFPPLDDDVQISKIILN